jgi:hypothetical protein
LRLTGAALLGALGELVAISRYPKHDSFGRCIFHLGQIAAAKAASSNPWLLRNENLAYIDFCPAA